MSSNNPTKAGNFKEVDAVKTTDWALLCLSREQSILNLELLNLKTDRAHKLVFTCSGVDEIIAPGAWTQGKHYEKFQTKKELNFDDFHEILSMITPGNAPLGMDHIFRIGLLATINLPQSHGELFGKWQLFGLCKISYGSGNRTMQPIFSQPVSASPTEFSFNYARVDFVLPSE